MALISLHPQTLIRKARRYTRKLWVRVVLMGLLAFVTLGIAPFINRLLPEDIGFELNGAAADRLLNIIANAMLAVTTFSLTVMVTVYRASSQQWTPRIHRLIVEDQATQNTLAVFVGAYVYALSAIVLRELGIFVDDHAPVLFFVTVAVMAIIVIYLVRWILHLQSFGSLIDSARQIEEKTRQNFKERLRTPCLGATPLTGEIPQDAKAVLAKESGYIQHIYPEALQEAAEAHDCDVYLDVTIGSYVFINAPIAHVVRRDGEAADEEAQDYDDFADAVRANIELGDVRTYDQDPRFGLITMGEVASRALSPGINDPGTAIDMITRIGRVLSFYEDETRMDRDQDDVLDRLHVRPLDPGDLLEDGFGSVTRDGVKMVEVHQRLQKAFSGLMRHPDEGLSKVAREAAKVSLHRALEAMEFYRDRERLCKVTDPGVVEEVRAIMDKSHRGGAPRM